MHATVKEVLFLLAIAATLSGQPRPYQDPSGRFSLAAPAGWTVTSSGAMTYFQSGDAYALVTVIENGASDQRLVSRFTDQFGWQWKAYKRLQFGASQLGGVNGAFAVYSGTNPKGVEAIVKALSAPAGSAAYVLLFSCPLAQWESRKAAFEAMERSFSFGRRGAAPQQTAPPTVQTQAQAQPQAASRAGGRQLPAGFTIAGRNGPSGQALTASFNGGRSAKQTFAGIFKFIGPYFDAQPQLRAAVVDAQDREVQGFFRASFNGVPVKGMMVVTLDGGKGYTGILFDREDQFNRTLPALSRQMQASLPQGDGGGGGGGRPAPVQPLHRTQLTDGSGWVSIPQGWRITGSFKGVVDLVGPAGEGASFGGYQVAYVNPIGGPQPNMMVGPYRPPVQALYLYVDTITQRALSRRISQMRILEQAPVQAQQGQAAYISYEVTSQGQALRGLAMVNTAPIDNTMWFYYSSFVQAPPERFAQMLPTMWAMWKSWSVNPAVFRERMDAALQSMRETYRILRETNENTQRTYDNVNQAWSQVIRGVTTVENVVTRTRTDVDTNSVDRLVRELNAQGYNYRVVPLPELVQ